MENIFWTLVNGTFKIWDMFMSCHAPSKPLDSCPGQEPVFSLVKHPPWRLDRGQAPTLLQLQPTAPARIRPTPTPGLRLSQPGQICYAQNPHITHAC